MTKKEAEFQRRVRAFGCLPCHLAGHPETPGEIHHILDARHRRMGEWAVLCLCVPHHRAGRYDTQFASRHPNKAAFVKRYGTEAELLQKTRELLAWAN